ncbi:phage baseplate assembly protein [Caballeronia zhejiangensis]|uniref:phage baseplate assembly protein n=1 Tax=Caballeronia zhejiangensis TaxID=871203 RepID=UPI003132CA7D
MADDITLRVSTCTRNTSAALGEPTFTTSNGREISGWTQVRVSRGIERCPSDFEISFTEPYPGVSQVIVQPGDLVQVLLGKDVVLTGFVDRYLPSYTAREHTIRITGRSKCQDLVDCSAKWTGGQLLNLTVDQIAKRLCAVYGIEVNVATGTVIGDPIPQLNIMIGEPIYGVLERICRYRALLLYDQPDGSLLLANGGAGTDGSTGIGTRKAASGFKEGINVASAGAMYGMDGRFSDYDAVYQGLDTLQDIGDGGNLIAHVSDSGVPRLRYRAIVSENVAGGSTVAEQRANWELAARMGRSMQVRLSTDSWRDSAGTLYEPNTLVDIDLPGLKLTPKTWLIADVTYMRNEQGTRADLVIMPPQAFYPEPVTLFPIAPDYTTVNGVNS